MANTPSPLPSPAKVKSPPSLVATSHRREQLKPTLVKDVWIEYQRAASLTSTTAAYEAGQLHCTDPPAWSDDAARWKLPPRHYQHAAPPGWQYIGKEATVDTDSEGLEEDGWSYQSESGGKWKPSPQGPQNLRRRKWIRWRQQIDDHPPPSTSSNPHEGLTWIESIGKFPFAHDKLTKLSHMTSIPESVDLALFMTCFRSEWAKRDALLLLIPVICHPQPSTTSIISEQEKLRQSDQKARIDAALRQFIYRADQEQVLQRWADLCIKNSSPQAS